MATYDEKGRFIETRDEPTEEPGIRKVTVPGGTIPPSYVRAVSRDFPEPGADTWYYPDAFAYQMASIRASINAAVDTVVDTAGQVTQTVRDAAEKIGNYGPWVVGAVVVLYLMSLVRK